MKTTLPEEYTHEILAKKAYLAHGKVIHGREPMLDWEDQPRVIQQAWVAVVRALVPADFRLHIDVPVT